jgi:hypothetical protein
MASDEIWHRHCCMTYPPQPHSEGCQKRYQNCPDREMHRLAQAYGRICDACGARCG